MTFKRKTVYYLESHYCKFNVQYISIYTTQYNYETAKEEIESKQLTRMNSR